MNVSLAYGEIIATAASRSVGPGTRKNIDEFTRTTAGAVERIGGAKKGKAIIVINPAEPPLIMRDTVHCLTETAPDQAAITASVLAMVAEVQKYVPGYKGDADKNLDWLCRDAQAPTMLGRTAKAQ